MGLSFLPVISLSRLCQSMHARHSAALPAHLSKRCCAAEHKQVTEEVKEEAKEEAQGEPVQEVVVEEEDVGGVDEDGEPMNAYEREREERIAANRARMAALNLPGMAAGFADAHGKKPAERPARPRGLAAKRLKRVWGMLHQHCRPNVQYCDCTSVLFSIHLWEAVQAALDLGCSRCRQQSLPFLTSHAHASQLACTDMMACMLTELFCAVHAGATRAAAVEPAPPGHRLRWDNGGRRAARRTDCAVLLSQRGQLRAAQPGSCAPGAGPAPRHAHRCVVTTSHVGSAHLYSGLGEPFISRVGSLCGVALDEGVAVCHVESRRCDVVPVD